MFRKRLEDKEGIAKAQEMAETLQVSCCLKICSFSPREAGGASRIWVIFFVFSF